MTELVFATGNLHKLAEAQAIFDACGGGYRLLSPAELGVSCEVEETGNTFEANALLKADALFERLHRPVFADDSGICVEALGGAPGILSARYAGAHGNDQANLQKLLADMAGKENRGASFVCAVAFRSEESRFTVRAETKGELLRAPDGASGFGYDPIFFYPPLGASFASLSAEQKNKVSHRHGALLLLAGRLKEELF